MINALAIGHFFYNGVMEIFDIVDEYGLPTGETVERSVAHSEGIRHRTAHIWVVREVEGKYQILMQKRSMDKDSFPGCYDTSSAGHIHAGDEPKISAIREMSEEIGINALEDELEMIGTFSNRYEKEFYGKMFKDNEVSFVYVYDKDIVIDELKLQKEEVDSVKWFDIEYVKGKLEPRDEMFCVPIGGFNLIYQWCMEKKL